MCLTVQIVWMRVCVWPGAIYIYNKNGLTSFGHYRLVLEPISYTWPCLTILGSVPNGFSSTQANIGLLRQKLHVVNKTFPNVIKSLQSIIYFLPPYFCINILHIFNTFNLYSALNIYWHRNFIIVVYPSHPSPVYGTTTAITHNVI